MEDMPEAYRLRLHDLGFRQNAEVYCLRHAPFSGPRVFQVEDAVFALEKTVAVFVKVEPVEHE